MQCEREVFPCYICSRQYLCTVFSGECVACITDHYKHIVQINACTDQKVKNKIFVQLPRKKILCTFLTYKPVLFHPESWVLILMAFIPQPCLHFS